MTDTSQTSSFPSWLQRVLMWGGIALITLGSIPLESIALIILGAVLFLGSNIILFYDNVRAYGTNKERGYALPVKYLILAPSLIALMITLSDKYIPVKKNGYKVYSWSESIEHGLFAGALCFVVLLIYRQWGGGYERNYLKCISCRLTLRESDAEDGRCSRCGGATEPLEGFYERHPPKAPRQRKKRRRAGGGNFRR